MENQKVLIESLSVKQALKFFIMKERHRHIIDIINCNEDLNKLKDVEMPEGLDLDTWIEI